MADASAQDRNWHKLYPDEFEGAEMTAHGAIVGWTYGNSELPPTMTAVLKEAYRRAFAEVFDAGVEVGLSRAREGTPE